MGILDKLMFWKHDDEFDFDKTALSHEAIDYHKDAEFPKDHLGLEEKSPFPEEHPEEHPSPDYFKSSAERNNRGTASFQRPAPPPPSSNRELELINSKLDTLKAMLINIDQRLSNLEKAAGVEKKERLW
ncbi:MAG: hypothetical protein KKA62_04480 [Nanoarchaeota archaeon]|nr:hypothetical protein [Nanoarchaeota archaeon]MBU1643581.1 hypothetical protein [Nanoarchaeota archaeon]MBU1977177.1 hypothetical protein [Nanoarchaeota archaeon]